MTGFIEALRRFGNANADEVETWFKSWIAAFLVPMALVTTGAMWAQILLPLWFMSHSLVWYLLLFWVTLLATFVALIIPAFLGACLLDSTDFDLSYPASAKKRDE